MGLPRPVGPGDGRRRRRPTCSSRAARTGGSRRSCRAPPSAPGTPCGGKHRRPLRSPRVDVAHRPRARRAPAVVDPRRDGRHVRRVRALPAPGADGGDRRRGGAGEHDRDRRGSGHRAPGDDRSSRGMGHAGPVRRGDAHVRTRVGAGAGPQRGRCPHPRHAGVRRAVPATPTWSRTEPASRPTSAGRWSARRRRCSTPCSAGSPGRTPTSSWPTRRPARRDRAAQRPRPGVADDVAAAPRASRRRSRCRIPRCGPTSKC